MGIWFSFNGFAQILGGLIAYAIARGVDKHGSSIEGWKINFLWTGLLTIVVGIIFFFVVPDNQLNARFLSKEDQILAIERIRKNQQVFLVIPAHSLVMFSTLMLAKGSWEQTLQTISAQGGTFCRSCTLAELLTLIHVQGPPRSTILDVHVLRPRCGSSTP